MLYGMEGVGKTELAKALAYHDKVTEKFDGNIFWIDASQGEPEEWAKSLCETVEPLLLILDEVTEATKLEQLWGTLGSWTVVVVTTQEGGKVRTELTRELSVDKVRGVAVRGMEIEEGRQLVETTLERKLTASEWETVQQVGAEVGWHVEELFVAALESREGSWEEVLELAKAGPLSEWRFNRQWERLDREQQGRLESLVRWMNRKSPFGPLYGATVWNMTIERAKRQLRAFEGIGLVQQVEVHGNVLGQEGQLWQVTPVVYNKLKRQEPKGAILRAIEAMRRARLAKRLYKNGVQMSRMPLSFQVLETAWWVGALPKAVVSGILGSIEWVIGNRGWRPKWDEGTILMAAERHLKRRFRKTGIEPTAEFWLIYDSRDVAAVRFLVWEFTLLVVWVVLSTLISLGLHGNVEGSRWIKTGDVVVFIVACGLYLAICWQVAWRVWMAHLYGVETWDLRLVLRVARFFGMKDPKAKPEAE